MPHIERLNKELGFGSSKKGSEPLGTLEMTRILGSVL